MTFRERDIVKIIKGGVYAILFLPFLVIPQLFFPFATSRGFLFQIIVEVIFALYAVVAYRNPAWRPQKTALLGALFFYFIALLFSAIFGLDSYHSFFGNYERMLGVFQLSHFLLFFIVLVSVFKSKEDWRKLVTIALIIGALSVTFGLFQFFGSLVYNEGTPRISSTIGNPAFLASYLFSVVLFALVAWKSKPHEIGSRRVLGSLNIRVGYLVFAALTVFVMLATGTRGAFVGLAVAGATGTVLLAIFSRQRWIRFVSVLCVGMAVVGAFLFIQYGSLFEKQERISESAFYSLAHFDAPSAEAPRFGFLSRLTDFSIYDTTTLTRLATWKTVLASAKDYPFFGVGQENFILAFNKYFNSEFYTAERSEIWFDRAHNAYIDTLVMHGWLGLSAYLFLYVLCFFVIFRLYRSGALTPFSAFIFALFFVAYAVQNFFLFDSFAAFLMFIFVIAYLNSFVSMEEKPAHKNSTFVAPQVLIAPLIVVAVLVYFFTLKPAMESYYIAKAESGEYGIDQVMGYYDKALSYGTFGDAEARSRLALAVAKEVQSKKDQEQLPENLTRYLDIALGALEKNIETSNDYYLLHRLQLADIYNLKLSRTGLASSEIEDVIRKSIAISPGRMEFEFALAQAEFLKGNFEESTKILLEASKKNPEHPMPYWKIAQNYYFMSKGIEQSDPKKAKALLEAGIPFFEKALYLGHGVRNYQEVLWAMDYYNAKEEYPKIIFLNKLVLAQNPKDAVSYHMNLAIAYKALDKKDKAREHALKVGELAPSQQPAVDNFLKELERN